MRWDSPQPSFNLAAAVEQMSKPPAYRPPAISIEALADLQRRGYYRTPVVTRPMSKPERRLARRNQRTRR